LYVILMHDSQCDEIVWNWSVCECVGVSISREILRKMVLANVRT